MCRIGPDLTTLTIVQIYFFFFNLICIHLIHKGYDPSGMEIVSTEIGLQINIHTYIHDV
jgi:hypothetical protein